MSKQEKLLDRLQNFKDKYISITHFFLVRIILEIVLTVSACSKGLKENLLLLLFLDWKNAQTSSKYLFGTLIFAKICSQKNIKCAINEQKLLQIDQKMFKTLFMKQMYLKFIISSIVAFYCL